MVSHHRARIRNAAEDALAVVPEPARLAVHGLGRPDHVTAEGIADALMSQTDPEQRDRRSQLVDHVEAYTKIVWIFRIARPRRDHDVRRIQPPDRAERRLVVTDDGRRTAGE